MSARYIAVLILLASLWGASFLFMRIAAPEFGAVALIQIRVTLASAVLLPIWWLREGKSQYPTVRKKWRELAIIGLINSAIPFVLFAYSTLHITGGLSAILNSTAPIWGALIGFLWLKRAIAKQAIIGLGLGIIGVLVLVSGSLTTSFSSPAWIMSAISAGLFAAFLYGIAANYTGVYLDKVSSLSIATFSLVSATLALTPFSIAVFPEQSISLKAWASVVAMGVFCTAFANILFFDLLENVGPTKALTVTLLIPLFASIWGALFIDEHVTNFMIIGGSIILLGLSLVTGLWPFKQ
jgi:drug/metabolite transporter (DMT)-like permease